MKATFFCLIRLTKQQVDSIHLRVRKKTSIEISFSNGFRNKLLVRKHDCLTIFQVPSFGSAGVIAYFDQDNPTGKYDLDFERAICYLPFIMFGWRKWPLHVNTLRPRDGRNFANDIFMCIFLNENVWISIKISLEFVPTGSISNIPALVQIMAWRRLGDKPLSEPMLACSPTHICVSWPQWVKSTRL